MYTIYRVQFSKNASKPTGLFWEKLKVLLDHEEIDRYVVLARQRLVG